MHSLSVAIHALSALEHAIHEGKSPYGDTPESSIWPQLITQQSLLTLLGSPGREAEMWRQTIAKLAQWVPVSTDERQRGDEAYAIAMEQAMEQEQVLAGIFAKADGQCIRLTEAAPAPYRLLANGARFLVNTLKDRPENDSLPERTPCDQVRVDWLAEAAKNCSQTRSRALLAGLQVTDRGEVRHRYDRPQPESFPEVLSHEAPPIH